MLKNIIAIAVAAAFGTAALAQGTATSPAKPADTVKPAAQAAAAPAAAVATSTAKPVESAKSVGQVAAAPAPATATPAAGSVTTATPAKGEAVAVEKTPHAKPQAKKAQAAPAVTTPPGELIYI